jgi:hypothetical protein
MSIIELPSWRLSGQATDRAALRAGIAAPVPAVRVVKTVAPETTERALFCDRCAAPVEFGAVTRGLETYCSVECSLEGPGRPA